MTTSVQRLGEDLCAATGARERIRAHPLSAVGLSLLAGFVVGPMAFGALRSLLGSFAGGSPRAAGRSSSFPGVVLASVRSLRAGR